MHKETQKRLLDLNRLFYQKFASHFSATRQRLQPGVQRILERLPLDTLILDLGCGNGELARELSERGFQGVYVGLDFSVELLQFAGVDQQDKDPSQPQPQQNSVEMSPQPRFYFIPADLSGQDWDASVPLKPFDYILSFAVLHHIPGDSLREKILQKTHQLLKPHGQFIHSEWQFLNSDRLRARLQPWDALGLSAEDVDPDDYLMDWRRGGYGLRYVHHFNKHELEKLADKTGFRILETFYSDGETGNLGIYQVWERVQ